jgi:hypothetical protein
MGEHRITGTDGKSSPRFAPAEDRDYVSMSGQTHYLRHDEGMSVRQIVKTLQAEEVRRPVGSVAGYLKDPWEECSGVANESPEQPELAPNTPPEHRDGAVS